jgi:hypothetical protein
MTWREGMAEGERATFLVERYWPGITAETLAAAISRGQRAADELTREGRTVRYVLCTFVPGDEAVLCLWEAASAEEVAEANERAEFPFDRIVEAVPLGLGEPAHA